MAIAYLTEADTRNIASTSRRNRARLERKISDSRVRELANDIIDFGVKDAASETDFDRIVRAVAGLDQRTAAPLWSMLEKRFIAMAENDIEILPEIDRPHMLQRVIGLSCRHLPPASQGVVLAKLAHLINIFFAESRLALNAVDSIFASCKTLPPLHQVRALRNMMLSVPFISESATDPQSVQISAQLHSESRKLAPEQRDALEHDLMQAHATIGRFLAALADAGQLPLQQHHARLKELISQIASAPQLHVEHMIKDVLNHFIAHPELLGIDLLTRLIPTVGLIENTACRAGRLQSMLPLIDLFAEQERIPALQHCADIALTLSEADRKSAFVAMCSELAKLRPADRRTVFDHVTPLADSLPIEVRAELLSRVPVSVQAAARAAARMRSFPDDPTSHY